MSGRLENSEREETVAELLAQQVVVPGWILKAVEGLADTDVVIVTRAVLPFGSYVLRVIPLPKEGL